MFRVENAAGEEAKRDEYGAMDYRLGANRHGLHAKCHTRYFGCPRNFGDCHRLDSHHGMTQGFGDGDL